MLTTYYSKHAAVSDAAWVKPTSIFVTKRDTTVKSRPWFSLALAVDEGKRMQLLHNTYVRRGFLP